MKDILAGLAELGDERAAEVRSNLSDAALATITNAPRTSWLDAELIIELDQALLTTLGPERFEAFWIDFASHATRIPIIRPLAAGALRLLGTPRGVLKALVMAYGHMTRGLGAYTIHEQTDGHALLRIDGVSLSNVELFAIANRAALIGTMTMVGTVAEIGVKFEQGPPGWVEFDVRW